MKWIKRLLLLTSVFLFLSACGSSSVANVNILERVEEAENPKIVWGVKTDTNLSGIYNIETGEIEGFDIDIAKALTDLLTDGKGEPEFVEVTSKTRIPLLKNGNIDAIIATMTINEERAKIVDFTESYFDAGQNLLVPEGSHINGISDLTSADTVIAIKGSTSAQNIREHAPEANVIEMENYSEGFVALQSGQGDALTTDATILMGLMDLQSGFRLAGENFTYEPYGIAVNKGQEDFVDALDKGLEELKANGTYDQIVDKWYGDYMN